MPLDLRDDDELIDPTVHCDDCEAVCCRLLVIVEASDRVPRGTTAPYEGGLQVMPRSADGWCVAIVRTSMCRGIYEAVAVQANLWQPFYLLWSIFLMSAVIYLTREVMNELLWRWLNYTRSSS